MSKMIPRRSIDRLREYTDISLGAYGIDCEVYVPTNLTEIESLDVYSDPTSLEWEHYTATVFIEWNPNIHKLKALGIYVEDELPIIVYLPNVLTNDDGEDENVDILRLSYLKVPLEYIPSNYQKYQEFELVDLIVHRLHDAVVVQRWKAVPRRVPVPENRENIGS